jgi:predicted XRE-type DNA-binding protein
MSLLAKISDRERTKALGEWGERNAIALLQRAGFDAVRDLNAATANHPFGDVFAERGGSRYLIGVKTRNKFQANGALNPAYNVRKRGADVEAIAMKGGAILAWVALSVIPENHEFSAYFGTIAQIEDGGERFSIPMKPERTLEYECLADREIDRSLRVEWSNGGYARAVPSSSRSTLRERGRKKARKLRCGAGTDNIFADLGLPDAGPHFLKAQIVAEIYRLATARKLTQAQVGKRLGISQPEVSRLFKGHFREYSIERLMAFLTSSDRDVEIVVRPHKKSGKPGRITFKSGQAAA